MWDDCGVVGDRGPAVIERGEHFADTRFFPDARLSVAENLLWPRAGVDPDADALVAVDETGARVSRSWEELRGDAAATASALRALGVRPGDRVVTWLPNALEAVIVMLGATSIGAVYSSTSPDFGAHGVLDRFGQIEPVVLFAADSYLYGGKRFDCLERLDEIRAGLPTLRATVVVGDAPAGTVGWEAFLAPHRTSAFAPEQFAFDHPWYVLYSSGTTGVPKCIVHRAGGVLLQHLKEHQLHCDIRLGDRVMYFTTTGWMMWNWLASTLASGATAVLYDGSPFHPGPNALFDVADAEQLTLLGVSAKFIDSVGKARIQPITTHGFDALRTICSTGSPLSPDGFRVVYERVKPDVHLASIAGGTDLCGCLVGGDPTGPVYAGEIQRPALGMAVDVAADDGSSLRESPGVPGELVCRQPFPSMPLGFWDDESGRAVPRRVLRAVSRGVGARRLRVVDGARRHGHPRAERRHAQPRWRTNRHGGDLPGRRGDARGAGGARVRAAVGRRRAHRAARPSRRRRDAHRRARRRDPFARPHRVLAPTCARGRRRG